LRPSLDNVRLRDKMLLLYFMCVFLPIVVTNVVFYNVTTTNVKSQRMQDIARAIEQVKNEFRAEVETVVALSTVFYTDNNVNEIMDDDYARPQDYIEKYDYYLRRILNPGYNSVQNIKIYADNPTIIHSGGIGLLTDEVKRSNWYRAVRASDASLPLLIRTRQEEERSVVQKDGEDRRDTFSIVRKIDYYPPYNKWEKIIKIDMKTSTIAQIFSNLNLTGPTYLLNDRGEIEYSTDPNLDWGSGEIPFDGVALPERSYLFDETYEGVGYLNGWRIVSAISEDEVYQAVRSSRESVILLAFFNIVFATAIIVWISRSMNRRLVNILRHMKKVKNQNFATIKTGESRDEIGQLTVEFNRMTNQIKSLIDDVYVADIQTKALELERRQAQLNALQSQINPHFLFNALETIRMRSVIKDETETAKIIANMAKLFRTSLTWNKDRITVAEEMELILCFLEIQKYRFEDRLRYEIDVDPEARGQAIPKMMFLPFVENACIHGVEPRRNGSRIDIRIARDGEELVFSVQDNGNGMSEENVAKFYRYLDSDETIGERIGVQNVIYRLKLIYRDRFRMRVESRIGEGLFVELRVPCGE